MSMILLGSSITADEAERLGLIAGLYEPGKVLDGTLKAAKRIAAVSSSAVSLAKEAICRCKCCSHCDTQNGLVIR